MASFPPLNSDKLLPLKVVCQGLKDDPAYLDRPDCPYSPEVRDWLKANLSTRPAVAVPESESDVDLNDPESWDDISKKALKLYSDLEKLAAPGNDVGENIAIIKTKAALLERLITVGDKALGHKEVAEFKRIVLGIMDDVMSPDQRTSVMEKLERFA